MVKYYGTPLTPNSIFDAVFTGGRSCLIPYPNPQNLKRAKLRCNKTIIDNGAFTIWRKGGHINWGDYYKWVHKHITEIEFYFIPDVIDGTERENDALIVDFFKRFRYDGDSGVPTMVTKGVPIWHVNESTNRLKRLIGNFDYIAIGSAGDFAQLGTPKWEEKMDEAMRVICDADGYPKVKIHMLRCLDPKIFTRFPFYSGDSTALAQNHTRDGWINIVNRIEKYDSPKKYIFRKFYKTKCLFGGN